MSKKNPEYDFKWCPGCGDFGVRRALEMALERRSTETELPVENNVVVAGIGCSGNLVHLLEGVMPYGIHGIHGRTLPTAFGIKMARPELNVVVVAGDGDFLSIGAEHIGPQAQRNLNVTAIVMDNAIYGLTKGQSSPTSKRGAITSTTPYGKVEGGFMALELYLGLGVGFVASGFSARPRELADLILQGMDYPGFAIVHVQSPCVTYNDMFEAFKGNPEKGITPAIWDVSETHRRGNMQEAHRVLHKKGVPLGVIYQRRGSEPLEERVAKMAQKARPRTTEELLNSFRI